MQEYKLLEEAWDEFTPGWRSVACSSGTAALHLALECLNLPRATRIAIPDYTMVSCARACVLAGLTPVLVGWGGDLLMDMDCLDSAMDAHGCRAIMAVHVHGRRCPMDQLHELASKYGVPVVEDLAEAHGIQPHPSTTAACWSFYKNKVVHGEEGGAVAFHKDHSYAVKQAKSLRCVGFTEDHDYNHIPRGHNYRLANLLAGPILTSIKCHADEVRWRRKIEMSYDNLCPKDWLLPRRDVPWVYDIAIPLLTEEKRAVVIKELQQEMEGVRYGFVPMSHQSEFRFHSRVIDLAKYRRHTEVITLPLTHVARDPADLAATAFAVLGRVLGK